MEKETEAVSGPEDASGGLCDIQPSRGWRTARKSQSMAMLMKRWNEPSCTESVLHRPVFLVRLDSLPSDQIVHSSRDGVASSDETDSTSTMNHLGYAAMQSESVEEKIREVTVEAGKLTRVETGLRVFLLLFPAATSLNLDRAKPNQGLLCRNTPKC